MAAYSPSLSQQDHFLLIGSLDKAAKRLGEACWELQRISLSTPAWLRYQISLAASEIQERAHLLGRAARHSDADEKAQIETIWDGLWNSLGKMSLHVGSAVCLTIGKRGPEEKMLTGQRDNAGLEQIRKQLGRYGAILSERQIAQMLARGEDELPPCSREDALAISKLSEAAADTLVRQNSATNWIYNPLVDVTKKLMAVVEHLFVLVRCDLVPAVRHSLADEALDSLARLIPACRKVGTYRHPYRFGWA